MMLNLLDASCYLDHARYLGSCYLDLLLDLGLDQHLGLAVHLKIVFEERLSLLLYENLLGNTAVPELKMNSEVVIIMIVT